MHSMTTRTSNGRTWSKEGLNKTRGRGSSPAPLIRTQARHVRRISSVCFWGSGIYDTGKLAAIAFRTQSDAFLGCTGGFAVHSDTRAGILCADNDKCYKKQHNHVCPSHNNPHTRGAGCRRCRQCYHHHRSLRGPGVCSSSVCFLYWEMQRLGTAAAYHPFAKENRRSISNAGMHSLRRSAYARSRRGHVHERRPERVQDSLMFISVTQGLNVQKIAQVYNMY